MCQICADEWIVWCGLNLYSGRWWSYWVYESVIMCMWVMWSFMCIGRYKVVCFHICSVLGNLGYIWGLWEMCVVFVFKEHGRLDEYFLWWVFAFFIRGLLVCIWEYFCIDRVMELCVYTGELENCICMYWGCIIWLCEYLGMWKFETFHWGLQRVLCVFIYDVPEVFPCCRSVY